MALRAGYVHDAKTANEQYPTAFGTPPGATTSSRPALAGTAALGKPIAYAYRFGSGDVTLADLSDPERKSCQFAAYRASTRFT